MPARLRISSRELDGLTVKDLEGVRIIEPTDLENWTDEHRLILKKLADQRGLHRSLDAAELNQRLEALQSSVPTPDSRVSSPDLEDLEVAAELDAIEAENRRKFEKYHRDLIERGGRPAASLEVFYTEPGTRGEYDDILSYWAYRGGPLGQLWEWVYFQRFQKRHRRTTERFTQYQQTVHEYRQNEQMEGDIHLHFDTTQQTKVDEWKEYHYFQHRKLAKARAKAEEGRQWLLQEKKRWEEGNGDPLMPAQLFNLKTIPESDLDEFMVFLNWIEQQLPQIARECALSDKAGSMDVADPEKVSGTISTQANIASTALDTKKITRSKRPSTKRNSESTKSALGTVGAPRVTKASRKTKSSRQSSRLLSDVAASDTAPTIQRHGDTRRITRTQNSAAIATMNTGIQTSAKASVQSSPDPVPLRRSQRIRDMKARRNEAPDMLRQTKQKPSGVTPQRKPKLLPSQTTSHGITKSRATKKRNLRRGVKELNG